MGRAGLPLYGEDLGSAIETAEKLIEKIKTNKYSEKDLLELIAVNNAIVGYLIEKR